jgi:hypothetical protein
MAANEHETVFGRLVDIVPASYRREVSRAARRLRDRLPPVVIEHRLEAMDRRLKVIERKLDALLRRGESKAA